MSSWRKFGRFSRGNSEGNPRGIYETIFGRCSGKLFQGIRAIIAGFSKESMKPFWKEYKEGFAKVFFE